MSPIPLASYLAVIQSEVSKQAAAAMGTTIWTTDNERKSTKIREGNKYTLLMIIKKHSFEAEL